MMTWVAILFGLSLIAVAGFLVLRHRRQLRRRERRQRRRRWLADRYIWDVVMRRNRRQRLTYRPDDDPPRT
jgi:uncharacterized membrane protein YfcA